ncbi:MAG: hypothetical protein SangKO_099940 [Sandaracinaceae bacterium]
MTVDDLEGAVCWDPAVVARSMNIEAVDIPRPMFLAAHHPLPLFHRASVEASHRRDYTADELLGDLLDETERYRFVAVLGNTGTGKSHLIRWLSAHIDPSDRRRVILVKKTGTSMRDVLDEVLDGLDGELFDEYRRKIKASADVSSPGEGQDRLLTALAHSLRYDTGAILGQAQGGDLGLLEDLADILPDLLTDPHLRATHWLKAGGIVPRLYEQAFGRQGSQTQEGEEVELDDLPTNPSAFVRASAEARAVIGMLQTPTAAAAAVELLNLAFNYAIPRALGLKGQDLYRLFLDVRRTFFEQGRELVFLVEDLSKMQGLDLQLIEALQVPPQVDDESYCTVRTVVGVTQVYLDRLADTARDRTTSVVSLDLIGSERDRVDLPAFASRYLNVARLDPERLDGWADDPDGPPPSACDDCPVRAPCHDGFGHVDGVGLYPFNRTALERMYDFRQRDRSVDVFRPRVLITQVLRHTLLTHQDDIRRGRFPNPALQSHIRGSSTVDTLPTAIVARLEAHVANAADVGRWQALLDLWESDRRLHNLDPAVHEAFQLPPLDLEHDPVEEPAESPPVPEPAVKPEPTTPSASTAIERRLHVLEKWRVGDELDDQTAELLRNILFDAIAARVDWETERLYKPAFVGRSGANVPFKRTSIAFHRQYTSPRPVEIRLWVPDALDSNGNVPTETVIALQGALLYAEHGHWRFENGPDHYRPFARSVERWAGQVVQAIRSGVRHGQEHASDPWDPVAAAAEVLAVLARMAGHPAASDDSLVGTVDTLFSTDLPDSHPDRSPSWSTLYAAIAKEAPALRDTVWALALCHKGNSAQTPFLDATPVARAVRRLRKNSWVPRAHVPAEGEARILQQYEPIRKARAALDEHLETAIREEKEAVEAWLGSVAPHLGPEPDRDDVADRVDKARIAVVKSGVGLHDATFEALKAARRAFRKVDLGRSLSFADRVAQKGTEDAKDRSALLRELGLDRIDERAAVAAFVQAADVLLSRAIQTAQTSLDDLNESDEAGEDLDQLREALEGLDNALATLSISPST